MEGDRAYVLLQVPPTTEKNDTRYVLARFGFFDSSSK